MMMVVRPFEKCAHGLVLFFCGSEMAAMFVLHGHQVKKMPIDRALLQSDFFDRMIRSGLAFSPHATMCG